MTTRAKKSYFVPCLALANILFLAVSICALIPKRAVEEIEVLEIIVCLLYLNITSICIKDRGIFNTISIMLYLFFIFLLSNVVFDLFGIESMRESEIHLYYPISNETLITILIIMLMFLIVVYIASHSFMNIHSLRINIPHNVRIEKTTQWLILLLFPFAVLGNLIDAISYSVSSTAYAASYIEDSSSSVLSICEMLLRCVIPVYLVSMPKGKHRNVCFAAIVVYIVSLAFGGSRTQAILPLCFLLWYYFNTGHSFSKIQYIAGALILFVAMTFVVMLRGSAASWNLLQQIASDNATFIMMANVIDYGYLIDEPNNNLYFLSGFINPILRYIVCPEAFVNGRNESYADASFSLDHKIMYAIDPNAFAVGRGFGSSALIEFYLFGGFVSLVAMSYIFIYLTRLIEYKACNNPVVFIFFYWWFQSFVFSPRGSALPNLFNVSITFLLFGIAYFIARRPTDKNATFRGSSEPRSQFPSCIIT